MVETQRDIARWVLVAVLALITAFLMTSFRSG
jgi:hypothetical protein